MKLKLPSDLKTASLFIEQPITVFKFEDVLDERDFENLQNQVSEIASFQHEYADKGGKKKTTISGHNVSAFIGTPLGDLTQYILSNDFFTWFKKTHLPFFISKPPLFAKNLRNVSGILLRIGKKLGLPYSLYFAEVEFSSIAKGRSIPPHTDDPTKRLSFVLYLGGRDLNDSEADALGTRFYRGKGKKSAWSRFDSGLLAAGEVVEFFEEHTELVVVPFRPNTVAGFIKSDVSWHSVNANPLEYDRRAIVINMFEYR